jgi:hypothetical protein
MISFVNSNLSLIKRRRPNANGVSCPTYVVQLALKCEQRQIEDILESGTAIPSVASSLPMYTG